MLKSAIFSIKLFGVFAVSVKSFLTVGEISDKKLPEIHTDTTGKSDTPFFRWGSMPSISKLEHIDNKPSAVPAFVSCLVSVCTADVCTLHYEELMTIMYPTHITINDNEVLCGFCIKVACQTENSFMG